MKRLIGLAVMIAASLALYAEVPKGWFLAGSKPAEYEVSVDNLNVFHGLPSAYLRSKKSQVAEPGFGTLMQNFAAGQHIGKRVRLAAYVKSEDVTRWAGLWMRVDGKPGQTLSFDNMQDRPIKGTTAWTEYEVVLDVPEGATGIYFGILLDGPGTVWINDVMFDEVALSVPSTTSRIIQQAPTNLGFDK